MKVGIQTDTGYLEWKCLGCGSKHAVPIDGPRAWKFNGDMQSPTLDPSVKVTWGDPELRVCHSFIQAGFIRYGGDCTHTMAGQTVEMEEL